MTAALRFDPIRSPPECEKLRKEVAGCLADEIAAFNSSIRTSPTAKIDALEFSCRVGAKGWLGMTWPKKARPASARKP